MPQAMPGSRAGLVPMALDLGSFCVRNTKYSSSRGTKIAIFFFMGALWGTVSSPAPDANS